MKRLFTTTLVAGLSLAFVLPSCVSSRKYRESQSQLTTQTQTAQQLREDSARLASENASLQQKLSGLESTNTALKSSYDSLNTYIGQQKPNMDYQAYFTGRQTTGNQLQQSLASDLAAHGVMPDAVEHNNYGTVSVSLDEKKYFSGGSANLNASGKKVISQIASAVKNQTDYFVGVMPAEIMTDDGTVSSEKMTSDNANKTDNSTASPSSNTSDANGSISTDASKTSSAKKSSTVRRSTASSPRKYSSESGNGTVSNKAKARKATSSPMSLRTARATNVAKSLLKEGVSEVSVTLRNDKIKSGSGQKDAIKVVLSPDNSKMMGPQSETAKSNPGQ